MIEPSGLYYPNRLARIFLLAMEDVMGRNGLNAVLDEAGLHRYIDHLPPDTLDRQFDFADMAALSAGLETLYGPRGGRGLALRVGRACFVHGMKTFGALAGVNDPAFKALPQESRTLIGLQALAAIFSTFSDQQSHVEEGRETYTFYVDISPMCWGRNSDKPVCHALAGMLQECLRWSSGGFEFHVQERACHAMGEQDCVFVIAKKPIGRL